MTETLNERTLADADAGPLRPCDECGGVDRAPKHTHGLLGQSDLDYTTRTDVGLKQLANCPDDEFRAAVLQHIQDRTTQIRHMDCCRAAGCPTGECDAYAAGGAADLRDEELRQHIQANYPNGLHGERADNQPGTPAETQE